MGIIDPEEQDKLTRINKYLKEVVKILEQERTFTKNSWKLIGKDLFIFVKIYSKLLTSESCNKDHKKSIGIGKEWTMYLCLKNPPNNYRPFRLLYKLLGFIGILYTQYIYFYIYGDIFKTYKIDANSELQHDYFVENLKINSQITRVIEKAREN